jgi:hypothetical protein
MDLRRALRVLSARWYLVLVPIIAGAVLGWVIASVLNQGVETEVASSVQLTFPQARTELRSAFDTRVDAANLLVQQLVMAQTTPELPLTALLLSNVGESDASISITMQGPRPNVTEDGLTAFVNTYLEELAVSVTTRLQESLDPMRDQLLELRIRRNALATLTPEQLRREAERSRLERELEGIKQGISGLYLEKYGPPRDVEPRPTEQIDAEINGLVSRLANVQSQLDQVASAYSLEQELDMDLLDTEINEVELRYLDTVRQLHAGSDARVIPPLVSELTTATLTEPTPIARAALLGSFVGLLGGLGAVTAVNRIRQPVWSAADVVQWPVFAELGTGHPHDLDQPWYLTTPDGSRKLALQSLRAWTEGLSSERGAVVGLVGQATASAHLRDLAVNLAIAISLSDRSVLLVETNFGGNTEFGELSSSGPTVTDLLEAQLMPNDSGAELVRYIGGLHGSGPTVTDLLAARLKPKDSGAEAVRQAFGQLPEATSRFRILRAGAGKLAAGETLAGRRFALILSEGAQRFDVVLVVATDVAGLLNSSFPRSLDQLIVVMTAGRSAVPDLARLARALQPYGIPSVGGVLLYEPLLRPFHLGSRREDSR